MKNAAKLVVRSYECDSYNHVNNAVYLNYLEYGRMEFIHQAGIDYKGILNAGYYLYITHIDIKYKASAFLDDVLIVETEPVKLSMVKGQFTQNVKKEDGTVCAEAVVDWACVNKNGRPARFPKEFMVPGLIPEENK